MKPLYGNGGAAVFKVGAQDPNFGSLYDLFAVTFREPWVVQRFLPKITEGDKRIILVDGVAMGAINRVPARERHPLQHGARRRRDSRPTSRRASARSARRSAPTSSAWARSSSAST